MCFNSVTLLIVILDVMTVEQWDKWAAQVTLRFSDVLWPLTALSRHPVLAVTTAISCSNPTPIWIRLSHVLKASTHVNISIIGCKCEHVSAEEGSWKGCETKPKRRFLATHSILLECNNVSTDKTGLAGEE